MPVRPGNSNDELKFALRSIAMNLPHGRIWFVGFKPSWVTNVEYIDGGNSAPWPRANLYNNVLLACRYPGVSDDVLIFNDDMFVIGPLDSVPILYRGTLADQLQKVTRRAGTKGWWQESLLATLACLQAAGYPDPLSYELHTPLPVKREAMAQTLARFADVTPHNPPQWRTLYGVTNSIGGEAGRDCKALRPGPLGRPFHSTEDLSWRYFRARFLQLFPEPSPYETPAVAARPAVSVARRNQLRATRRIRA